MPSEQTRNVSLTAEPNRFILAQVASGHYRNASEVVRASLRLIMQQVGPAQPHAPAQPDEMATPRAATRGRHARQS